MHARCARTERLGYREPPASGTPRRAFAVRGRWQQGLALIAALIVPGGLLIAASAVAAGALRRLRARRAATRARRGVLPRGNDPTRAP
ncbi:MAG: hypothetical protein JSR54_14005 [Proteobacteria bacterium]|nr:hypothetical protein [Pseudomonadota bacterium]